MAEQPVLPDAAPVAFDLQKAIAQVRADFPGETDNFTFVDLSAPAAAQQFRSWLESTDAGYRRIMQWDETIEAFSERAVLNLGFCAFDPVSGKSFVGARSTLGGRRGAFDDPFKTLAYTFAHEVGHVITPGGIPFDALRIMEPDTGQNTAGQRVAQVNAAENAADSFAALYCLAKGWLDRDDIAHLALNNANFPLFNADFAHFTTVALERILISPDIAAVAGLTPREIRMIASRHGDESAASGLQIEAAFEALHPVIDRHLRDERAKAGEDGKKAKVKLSESGLVNHLAEAYEHAPRHSLEYFIARKLLPALLETGQLNGLKKKFHTASPEWDRLRDMMAQRTGEDRMENLIPALLQNKGDVTLPKGGAARAPVAAALVLRN